VLILETIRWSEGITNHVMRNSLRVKALAGKEMITKLVNRLIAATGRLGAKVNWELKLLTEYNLEVR